MYVFLKIVSFESSEVGGHRPLGCQQGHGRPPPGRRVPGPGASLLPGKDLFLAVSEATGLQKLDEKEDAVICSWQ